MRLILCCAMRPRARGLPGLTGRSRRMQALRHSSACAGRTKLRRPSKVLGLRSRPVLLLAAWRLFFDSALVLQDGWDPRTALRVGPQFCPGCYCLEKINLWAGSVPRRRGREACCPSGWQETFRLRRPPADRLLTWGRAREEAEVRRRRSQTRFGIR